MKQKVTNLKTKEIVTVDAIDAREMVKTGGWEIGALVDSGMVKKKPLTRNPGKAIAGVSKRKSSTEKA